MSSDIDIPVYDEENIKVNHIEVTNESRVNITLTFEHRKECLEATQFLTEIINAMINHPSLDVSVDDVLDEE